MINWWLIIVIIVVSIIVLGGIFYLLVVFSSPDDKNQAWQAKIVVILSLSLACLIVLMLPLDVANGMEPERFNFQSGGATSQGLNTSLMWQIVLISAVCFVTFLIPFAIFYYESYDTENNSMWLQLRPAICYSLGTVALFMGIVVIAYFASNHTASIEYTAYQTSAEYATEVFIPPMVTPLPPPPVFVPPPSDLLENDNSTVPPTLTPEYENLGKMNYGGKNFTFNVKVRVPNPYLVLPVSFGVFIIAIFSVAGWFLLFIFGGVGIASLPLDLFQDFANRPKPLTLVEYSKEKAAIARLSQQLIEIGEKLEDEQKKSKKTSTRLKKKVNLFKMDVMALEEKYASLEIAYKDQGGSPFVALGMLLLGILSICFSLMWILHIILWNITQFMPFLNTLFVQLDSVFSLFGVLAYGLFAFYLLWAVFKGCIKIGTRFLFFEIHPMKPGDTLMNSFLFNSGMILLTSAAVVQFAASSFDQYVANTAIDSLYGTYVRSMTVLKWIFQFFQYFLLAVILISFIFLLIFPRRKTTTGYQLITGPQKTKK